MREGFEQALRDEVTLKLGRLKSERRDLLDPTEVEACCDKCQTHLLARFYRAGYYRRSLLTFELWLEIKVPRVSYVCGGVVDFESVHLEPYGRLWFDPEERARELAGLCVSLRDSVEVLSWQNGQPLAIATLNRRMLQGLETFRAKWREKEPKADAALERDFDQSLVYLRVMSRAGAQGKARRVECLRTRALSSAFSGTSVRKTVRW